MPLFLFTKNRTIMTQKRFNQIMNNRSYTIMQYQPNFLGSLRISKDKMVVFNGVAE